jgi:two-component system phosphate regulon sensor histidine kinase PhoR
LAPLLCAQRLIEESCMPRLPTTDAQRSQIHAQQAALFDSMAEGVLVLDEQGCVQMANRAFVQLFTITGNLAGKTLIEALRLHEVLELAERVALEGRPFEKELRLPGLEERWVQINASPISGGDGQRLGAILVFHELTRLKQFERARQEFVANVSHELRTPLSHIKGYVETLLAGAKDDPAVATRFLQIIERNADRLRLLIEDLLTISELESGRLALDLQPVSVRAVVAKVLDDLRTRAAARGVTLTKELPDLTVRADATRLEQVLSNLVDNAIKYGRKDGRVRVGAQVEQGCVMLSVADDGPGLPAEALERVFERFYRVDKGRSRDQGGTGLGLAIVKHIVQSHGGKVWAKSQPGRGATFYFTLPS